MVYNVGGGNKSKGLARKFVVASSNGAGAGAGKTVRTVKEQGEQYAIVQKHLGNCMCAVTCSDGYRRLCIIRKKFTGRRKTDNNISSGSVVLVGLHDYSCGGASAADVKRCDLLYVYSEQEKEKLRKVCDLTKLNSALDDTSDRGGDGIQIMQPDAGCDIAFITSGTGVFNKYAKDETRRKQQPQQPLINKNKNVISGSEWLDDLPPEDSEPESESESESESDEKETEEKEAEAEAEEEEEEEEEKYLPLESLSSSNKSKEKEKQGIDIDDI
jgi:initiation factor 1A